MKNNQSGNVSLATLVGVVGVFAAMSQYNSVNKVAREADRNRLSNEMEMQAVSSLSMYKGLLSANDINNFSIYPEPYISSQPRLKQFAPQIASNASFVDATQVVSVSQPSQRKLNEARLTQIMSGAVRTSDICQGQECAQHNVKLLGYNRDTANPLRIVSADVEVATQVKDEKTGGYLQRKLLAQVPMEAPQVSSALLQLSQVQSGSESFVASADDSKTTSNVSVGVPDLTAELIVGGVAVSGQISIIELNKTFSSDDPDQFGLTADGFPKHAAVSIKNTGTRLVKTPVFQVETDKTYTIIARIQGVNEDAPPPELKLVLSVSLPAPPDASQCAYKCADTYTWYDGPFKGGAAGSYATMIPGKYTCMRHEGCNGSACIGKPIYSFDPAKNCDMEGPVGYRDEAKGCFAANTEIRMANGQLKKIQDIVPGDRVWNPILQRAFRVSEVRAGPESGSLVRLHFGAKSVLTITPDHPFMDSNGRWIQARELKSVLNAQGLHLSLRKEEFQPAPGTNVYNISIADEGLSEQAHFIEANGIVTGDLYLQNLLKNQPSLPVFDDFRNLAVDPSLLALQLEL